jgi:hypothetical protein
VERRRQRQMCIRDRATVGAVVSFTISLLLKSLTKKHKK